MTSPVDLLLDRGARPVIAHRGASGVAPENTLAAFDLAIDQGAEALELDVRVTGDGVPVVIHDPTLDRTTDRQGPVATQSLAMIGQADAGARFIAGGPADQPSHRAVSDVDHPFRGLGYRVPTLEQVLKRYHLPLLIEIKCAAAAVPAREVLERLGAWEQVVVASFHREALAPFQDRGWLLGAPRRDIAMLALRACLGVGPTPPSYHLYAVPFRYRDRIPVPTRRFIREAHRLGAPVHVWTVDRADIAQMLWSRGANGMVTNFPARLLEARHRWRDPPSPTA